MATKTDDLRLDADASAAFTMIAGELRKQSLDLAANMAQEQGKTTITRDILVEAFHKTCLRTFPQAFKAD